MISRARLAAHLAQVDRQADTFRRATLVLLIAGLVLTERWERWLDRAVIWLFRVFTVLVALVALTS